MGEGGQLWGTQPLVRAKVSDPLAIRVNVVYKECKSQENNGQRGMRKTLGTQPSLRT
jgi:hypothetical protein